jgi:1-acyl-sn-glycerol-3-phosphate acyltransferase
VALEQEMSGGLNYYWRLLATAGCFAVFGIGGLLLTLLVFPVVALCCGPRTRSTRVRWIIHKAFGAFIWLMESVGIMRFELIGGERLRHCRNTLVLANHPTLIDVVALISLMPAASCVVKQRLWRNPFLGGVVRAADYINNSLPETLIDDCSKDLAAGHPLIIFPEGTRSVPGRPLHFLRGASYIAMNSGVPVLPVLIDCHPTTLSKRERWYRIPQRRFHLRLEVLKPIAVNQWVTPNVSLPIAARRLTHALEAYFTQELKNHGRLEA